MTHTYNYPRPGYTADTVVFCLDEVLLIQRGKEPYKGCYALPGGFVNEGEVSRVAASRELVEETGLCIPPAHLYPVGIFDDPNRDPRGWVISAAYRTRLIGKMSVKGMDDAIAAEWVKLDDIDSGKIKLAFDHKQIINKAFEDESRSI